MARHPVFLTELLRQFSRADDTLLEVVEVLFQALSRSELVTRSLLLPRDRHKGVDCATLILMEVALFSAPRSNPSVKPDQVSTSKKIQLNSHRVKMALVSGSTNSP
jgi:hypothetical protein